MIIYLASPATQLHAEMMAGCDVLESFAIKATAQWSVRYRPTWRRVMLDSGAYSEMTTGKAVDLGAYVDFCVQHQAAYSEIVNLDVIAGDVSERVTRSAANLQRMRDAGLDPLPVFHQGEPYSVLQDLASCGRVGLGFQRPIRGGQAWLDECFARIPSTTKVHGFGMANERFTKLFPFHSVDSATWIHELKALSALSGQGSDVLHYLTQGELLKLVILKYQRLPMASAWAGKSQSDMFAMFDDLEEAS